MIKVPQEKKSRLDAREINAIIMGAFDEATDGGFVNRFMFERAMYVYAYIVISSKNGDKNDIASSIDGQSVLDIWNTLLQDGTAEKVMKEYENELVLVQDAANDMFDDYRDYQRSIRGVAGAVGGIIDNITNSLSTIAETGLSSEQYKEIMDIASKWGLKDAIKDNDKNLTIVQ